MLEENQASKKKRQNKKEEENGPKFTNHKKSFDGGYELFNHPECPDLSPFYF